MKNRKVEAMESKYGFGGRLKEEFPSQMIVDITEVCNLACIHCPHPAFKASEHYATRYLEPELNKKMVDEVREAGQGYCQYIRYTSNGEPLVHPKGYEMVEYAVKHSGTFVTMTTNGTIMTERKTRRLLDAGVHMIDISIDAHTPETYSRVRVNGDLNVTRGNVLRLIDWVKTSGVATKVVVSFVEQPENTHEAADFERYWKEQGASAVVVRRLHSAGGEIQRIAIHMKGELAPRFPCLYPWERLTLDPKGYLAFCPTDWRYASPFADFRAASIAEAWQGEFMRKLRQAHLENNFGNHAFCGQCPDWMQTRWPDEGRSYADLVADIKQIGSDA
jgi:sulfatase maturation enzyme AslB (radical SAM superfamily)